MEQQQRPPLFTKSKVIFGSLLVALILIMETILHIGHFATWPAFSCMILFFVAHRDEKQIPNIIVGACFGIINYFLLVMFIKAMAPVMGSLAPMLIYIGVFVAAIIILMDLIPWLFNAYAFMLLVITAVAAETGVKPVEWIIIQLVCGTVLVLGVYGIQKIVARIVGAGQSGH